MLSQQIINTVKSTAPLLADEGENITRLFYKKLFSNHPELKNIFNLANQGKGDQARALAESVFLYASHIDELDTLNPLVNRIAHKHASLQVSPDHYPIVGKFLLEAIKDHLKLKHDDPVLQAWEAAYQALANLFVRTEEHIYSTNEWKQGGWRGFRAFKIDNIAKETDEIKSFLLRPIDGLPIAGFQPGQFVGVKVYPESSEYEEIRQYSISSPSGESYYRITVKAEAPGTASAGHVSNYLHQARVGDELLLAPPTGDFVIANPDADLAFIGGGIGITPLVSMLEEQVRHRSRLDTLVFVHCCQDKEHHAMRSELRALSKSKGFTYRVAYERGDAADHIGYLDTPVLEKWLGGGKRDIYFCGPKPFMAALHMLLNGLGYAEEQLHYEIFGPRIRLN